MAEPDRLVAAPALRKFLTALFTQTGMREADAAQCGNALVQTNLWGIDSHGALRAPRYIERLTTGAVNPHPEIKQARGGLALEVLDGDHGMGFVVGRAAMQRAIQLAERFNLGAVGAVHSNHFGAAALYAQMATKRGLIGIAMTNVRPNIVAPGGSRPVIGNNPIAIGIPTFDEFPFLLDISFSNVAGGKLLLASQKGEKIPLDWATDRNGRPTDDPEEAFAGFLLPAGGHKGLGLAYVVDLLAGLITGGVYLDDLKSMYAHAQEPSQTCHFMLALNPLALISEAEMAARMADFAGRIKNAPMRAQSREMLLPGEREHRMAQARRREGIPLPQAVIAELAALGQKLSVPLAF